MLDMLKALSHAQILFSNAKIIPIRSASLDEIHLSRISTTSRIVQYFFWPCFNFHPGSLILPVGKTSIEFLAGLI